MDDIYYRVSALKPNTFKYNFINIGDAVQTYAVKLLLEKYSKFDDKFIDRYDLENESDKTVIVNGWFREKLNTIFYNDSLDYRFIGIHIAQNKLDKKIFNDIIPFGCRDIHTKNIMKAIGHTNVYTSLCLSLTLPERRTQPTDPTVIINIRPYMLQKFLSNATNIEVGKKVILDNDIYVDDNDLETRNWSFYEKLTEERLHFLSEKATIVYTDRLHTYLPCIAMRIPVVYVGPIDYRTEIVNIARPDTIDDLQPLIIDNFYNQVFGTGIDVHEELDSMVMNIARLNND